jgi:hypothetical protein
MYISRSYAKSRAGDRAGSFFVVNEHAVFARGKAMQFQEGYGGKAVGADRSALRRLEAKDRWSTRGNADSLFFLCSPLLFRAELAVFRAFLQIFRFARPLYRDLQLRHDN